MTEGRNKWAATWQNQQNDCAPSKDSDQPGHPPSLIRVFAVHMKKAWDLSYQLSAQRRLRSDWADAQADLSLRWAHSHSKATKGYMFNSKATKGFMFNSKATKGYMFNSKATKGYMFNSKATKGYMFNSKATKGFMFNSKAAKGDMFNLKATKGYMFNPEIMKGYMFNSKATKEYMFNSKTTKGYMFNTKATKGYILTPKQQKGTCSTPKQQKGTCLTPKQQKGTCSTPKQQKGTCLTPKQQKEGTCSTQKQQHLLGPVGQSNAPSVWYSGGCGWILGSGQISSVATWSWNNFYAHSFPTTDSGKAVVSYWWKYWHLILRLMLRNPVQELCG